MTISGKPVGFVAGSYWFAGILMVTVAGSKPVDNLKLAGCPPGNWWLMVTSGTTNQNSVSVCEYDVLINPVIEKKITSKIILPSHFFCIGNIFIR